MRQTWTEDVLVAAPPKLGRQSLPTKRLRGEDLLGAYDVDFGGGVSPAGRPRLPIRLMASLLYLKNLRASTHQFGLQAGPPSRRTQWTG